MTRLLRHPDIVVTTLDDGTFLVDPRTQAIFHLDALGGGVWSALAAATTRDDLLALLTAAFPDTPASTIARDLDTLLGELRARDLLIDA